MVSTVERTLVKKPGVPSKARAKLPVPEAGAAPSPKPRRRARAASGAKLSFFSSRLRFSKRMLTQAVTSVVEVPTSQRNEAATNDFQQMYASLVHAVPEELRLTLVERMKAGLDMVEEELRTALPAAEAKRDHESVDTAEFVARLEKQEQERREQQLASKELLSSAGFRARIGFTPQALSAAVKAKRIFSLQGPSGTAVYPAFFTDKMLDRPVLERVAKALGDLPGASKYFFFTSPRISLGGKSPLQALAKGKIEEVLKAAQAFVEE
jgi:hypothetical protein